MPRCVRNFWIELYVDGKHYPVKAGPRNRNGGFQLDVFMREKGSVSEHCLKVRGTPTGDGKLILEALHANETGYGKQHIKITTERDGKKKPRAKRKPHGQTRALKHFATGKLRVVGGRDESDAMDQVNDDRPDDARK